MRKLAILALGVLAGICANGQTTVQRQPAFPGAEGFGRYVTGGRGGAVYHVTTLDDTNTEGSLRWALGKSGAKTIVFDVSGTIHLTSELKINDNTTIAGQTAPGDGICVADYPVQIKGSNVIVRFMRFRLGNTNVTVNGADGWDGLTAMDQQDIIVDHCSVSWSIDECCSILGNKNTTLQWTLVAQSLVNSGHSKGAHGYGGNWGGSGASFHHNLIVHHTSRAPRLGPRPTTQTDERMDMRNNVIYNYGKNGCYGGEGMNVNIVNNYYKPGPGSATDNKYGQRIAGVGIRTTSYCNQYPDYSPMKHVWGKYFVEGNVNASFPQVAEDNWKYGILNQVNSSDVDGLWNDAVRDSIHLHEPIYFPVTTTHTAEMAYDRVLDYVGASLHRDSFDETMIYDTRNRKASATGTGLNQGFINNQNDNKPTGASADWSAWPALTGTQAPTDTDGDGMPDEWEVANGLNPNDASDRNVILADGYTALENYINGLVAHITEAQNLGGELTGAEEVLEVKDVLEISAATRVDTKNIFEDGLLSLSNEKNKGYVKLGDYMGFDRTGGRHSITLPYGVKVYEVKIKGYSRLASSIYKEATLAELNGTAYADGVYTLPKADASVATEFTVHLRQPAEGNLTMTWTENNPALIIYLYTNEETGISDILGDEPDCGDDAWYTITGIRLPSEPTAPGIYINRGKKVVVY